MSKSTKSFLQPHLLALALSDFNGSPRLHVIILVETWRCVPEDGAMVVPSFFRFTEHMQSEPDYRQLL